MKKILATILMAFMLLPFVKAAHVVGGDITVTWVAQNQYDIQLQFYRDNLGGGSAMPATVSVGIYEVGTNNLLQNVVLQQDTLHFVTLGDDCYSVDPNVYQIQKGTFSSTTPVNIPDFAAGYYLQYQTWARNTASVNLLNPGSTGISFFAMLSDPALGQNSTPQFDIYPADAYFCVNSINVMNLNVTDVDGDSLYYSLTTPLDGSGTGTGTFAGAGAYPYYNPVTWNVGGGYSLANIVGGAPAMSINPNTGDITAAPTLVDYYTFAVRVEEFRNGVKMGEIRRDIQYAGFACTGGAPPSFLNASPVMNETIAIEYNQEYCKDLIFNDINATDTLYIEMISPVFDSGAYQAVVPPDGNGDLHYFYNWNGTNWGDSVVIPPNQTDTVGEYNIGTVATRFCWTPDCDDVFGTFPFQVNAFSLGCDGKSQDSIFFNLQVVPPNIQFTTSLGNENLLYGINKCVTLAFEDSSLVDVLTIEVSSSIFDGVTNVAEYPSLSNNYVYSDGFNPPVVTGVPNNTPNQYAVGTQFCWTPDCENIGETYDISARLFSDECQIAIDDTVDFSFTVNPPFDSLDVIPNVITPNGDGLNDTYTLGHNDVNGNRVGGTSNPCEDAISIKIFNRWGVMVYENEVHPEFEWDATFKGGGDVPAGTYFVLMEGVYGNETVPLKKRTVTVLR